MCVCTHTHSEAESVDAAGKRAGRAVKESANGIDWLLFRDERWIRGHLWLGCNLDWEHGPLAISHVTRSSWWWGGEMVKRSGSWVRGSSLSDPAVKAGVNSSTHGDE